MDKTIDLDDAVAKAFHGILHGASPAQKYRDATEYKGPQDWTFNTAPSLGRFIIVPKGRRAGITRGAAHKFIEWMLEGHTLMWGDTTHSNIIRYVDRYFIPQLKKHNIPYNWRKVDKILEVAEGLTDFRSSDNPQNWEGFGYKVIFLNEAGIILDDEYIYYNAVLPMMADSPGSILIAAGTPKLTQGRGLMFQKLWEKVEKSTPNYVGQRFSSYENTWLNPDELKEILDEIAEPEKPQEIYGEFIDMSQLGSYFKRIWMKKVEDGPADAEFVRGWDLAATEMGAGNADPDWTVGVKLAFDGKDKYTICDVVKVRGNPGTVDNLLIETATNDGLNCMQVLPIDPGASGKTAFAHHRKVLSAFGVKSYPQTGNLGNKSARANPASVAASHGKFSYVEAPWNDWFFAQLAVFPNYDAHDDAVDALAAAFNNFNQIKRKAQLGGSTARSLFI